MFGRHVHLELREEDTERLRNEFHDENIYYCHNRITGDFEAWYTPKESRPYRIHRSENVCHAIRLMRNQLQFEQMRACDLLHEIDDYNEKLEDYGREDAMTEVRHDLKRIASGKKVFHSTMPR